MKNKKIFTTPLLSLLAVILLTIFTGCNVIKADLLLPQLMVLRKALASIGNADNSVTPATSGIDAPTFSPAAGTYTSTQSVSISTTTTGAILCYTTDGSTPSCDASPSCASGTLYSSPVSISTTTTLKALACKAGNLVSAVGTGVYVISNPCADRAITTYNTIWNSVTMIGQPNNGSLNYNEMFKQFGYNCLSDQIVFMPQDGTGLHTWLLNLSNHTWSEIFPSMPSTRIRYTMSDDPIRNRTLLFGGCNSGCGGGFTNELWAFDHSVNNWSLVTSGGPSARWGMILAYDSLRDRFIAFGGSTNTTCSPGQNDTWSYDPNLNSWTNLSPSTPPTVRCFGTEFIYDSPRDRFILHGGNANNGGTNYSDTCIYNPIGNSWSCSTPGSSPITSQAGQFAFVDVIGYPVRWGGVLASDSNEFHKVDSIVPLYTSLSQTSPPSARNAHGVIYDKRRNRLLLYGGRDGTLTCTGPPTGICLDMYEMKF